MVSSSSKGCQRIPILGTTTLVELFKNSSNRPEALNSNEYNPGIPILGLVIGICVSAKMPYALRPPKLGLTMADTNLIAGFVRIIRVKIKLFPTPVTAEGESNRPGRHLKQVGRVNVKVRRGQRRLRQVPDVCTSKRDRGKVARKRRLRETGKRIIRNCRPDKVRRIRIKNRVVRIHDAIKTRCRSRLNLGNGIDLTVAEGTVVAPVATKYLVAFDSNRRQPGLVLGIDQTIAEIEDTGPGATGDNLIERIKRIEGIGRGVASAPHQHPALPADRQTSVCLEALLHSSCCAAEWPGLAGLA